jgi:hypothetical protein
LSRLLFQVSQGSSLGLPYEYGYIPYETVRLNGKGEGRETLYQWNMTMIRPIGQSFRNKDI